MTQAQLFTSPRASLRRARALGWLRGKRVSERLLVIGASVEAAAELVRDAAAGSARTAPTLGSASGFGWQRVSLLRLAATVAAPELARRGLAPISGISLEALCARLLHEHAARAGASVSGGASFDPTLPGAARALARTLSELRLAAIAPAQVSALRPELGQLLQSLEDALAQGQLADRAQVLELAAAHLGQSELAGRPLLVLDAPIAAVREARFLAALASRAELFLLAPTGDASTCAQLKAALGLTPHPLLLEETGPLTRLQRRLFALSTSSPADVLHANENTLHANQSAPAAAPALPLEIFSAPGEGRECVEIARRVLAAASRGVPFDRMAVLLRNPALYRPLLEEALARAGIPAWFARGTSRPDPSGRAFLALLACADEGLSARRFSEYLSLGEVPAIAAAPAAREPAMPASGEELLAGAIERASGASAPSEVDEVPARASFRWEPLLVDAAVIGGREVADAKERWKRRLAKLREELVRQEQAYAGEEEEKTQAFRRKRDDLDALWSYAQPLLEQLSALPRAATWGAWLPLLDALAASSLRQPARVRGLLAQLFPLAAVGPVSLAEVQLLLSRELGELPEPPAAQRSGKLFVGPIDAARGHSFACVFVPGLAERLFPQKALPDPLLRDQERAQLDPALEVEAGRVSRERLQLCLAVGAAEEQLVLSWPRLELQLGRARVPSFYALEALAAAEGTMPGFAELSRRAEQAGQARAGWPAPLDPRDAIDAAEHDLALLGDALRRPEEETRGLGRYLLGANPALRRALYRRAGRPRRRWFSSDGLVDPSLEARAALQRHQLDARSYSASALQNFAACPYRFLLQAIHRLEPREEPEAIDAIDPLSRGSLMHDIQFRLFKALRRASVLPLYHVDTAESSRRLAVAQAWLERVSARVATRYRDDLAPAIARVWEDCIASIKADLREWLRRGSLEPRWSPIEFERSFGLADRGARDAHSGTSPVQLAGGLQLRGSIDLVEQDPGGTLRATDYKSGKQRARSGMVIGGGEILQPVLYALALEKLFPQARVAEGQLYYCTHAGEYAQVPVPLDQVSRDAELLLAKTLGAALCDGFFPAAPNTGACARCDYREVCGDGEEARASRKPKERLLALHTLRGTP